MQCRLPLLILPSSLTLNGNQISNKDPTIPCNTLTHCSHEIFVFIIPYKQL